MHRPRRRHSLTGRLFAVYAIVSALPVIALGFILAESVRGEALHLSRLPLHELGHNLGLHVVAEGVETDCVREQLRAAGTDLIQGYLLSRPLPLEQITAWLSAQTRAEITA